MIADRNQDDLILTVRMLDESTPPVPVPGIAWNDGTLMIGYKRHGDTVWTDLTLASGTLGVHGDSTWVADSGGNGLYELGVPNVSRIAGKRTLWRFKHSANAYRYDSIDYVAVPSENTDALEFSFNVPGTTISFDSSPTLYIHETGITATFTANQDISAIPLVIVFEESDRTDKFVFHEGQFSKVGDTVTLPLPNDFTEEEISLTWGIRNATSKRFYGSGSVSVNYAPHVDII